MKFFIKHFQWNKNVIEYIVCKMSTMLFRAKSGKILTAFDRKPSVITSQFQSNTIIMFDLDLTLGLECESFLTFDLACVIAVPTLQGPWADT